MERGGREGRLASNITMDAVCVGGGPPAFWFRSADDAGWVGKEGGGGVSVCDSTRKEGGRGGNQTIITYMPLEGGNP